MTSVVLAGTLLTGCGGQSNPESPSPTSSPTAPPAAEQRADPTGLIGLWKPTGADEEPEVVMRISAESFQLFRRCTIAEGMWDANEAGLFVGAPYGDDLAPDRRGCPSEAPPRTVDDLPPEWLARVTAFRAEGSDRLLLDGRGRVVIRLQPRTGPVDRPGLPPEQTGVPTVTAKVRRAFAPARPLPASLTPATPAALLGQWRPVTAPAPQPDAYVEFRNGTRWTGSDGCNGEGGRWAVGPAGSFVATNGPSTAVGCNNVPVGGWLDSARRVGLDGTVLVLLDSAGNECGRLRRER
ncbi:hypothetical protein ODJ79_30660 [Actinoplanes sp. KI2]|uniref:hypothetical protein n=1 Tax=Actinoplanes sp. KI2 TaxID=2983315 RepID=UPI0021D601B1|nr:hypothetical protein [Actinoplanes sp. KI2]MCU7728100.1 hypothetical protein [Actinoplanes sp. KI2]